MFSKRTAWDLEPNRLSQALALYRRSGKPLLDLTISNPTACGLPSDGDSVLQTLANPASLVYQPAPRGLESARGAVAAYYAARGADVPLDSILLAAGTSEAYSFLLRLLCDPGDRILVPRPGYPLLAFLADLEDVSLVPYPLVYDDAWSIDFPSLVRSISPRTRAVVVVHPHNPTGHFCRARDAERLAHLCADRGLALIADEVFLDFALSAGPRHSFASPAPALTFTLSGISKISGWPQMKAAWTVVSGPDSLRREALARLEVIADTFLSVGTPVQLALPALLDLRRKFQERLLARIRRNLDELDRLLAGQSRWRRLRVEGGWYVVLQLETRRSDEDLALELLAAKGVYAHPGHLYDFPANGFLVASLIGPEPEFAEAVRRLLALQFQST